MLISEKIFEKEFVANTLKDAYLKACKWISTNIIAVNNSEHITYKVSKRDGNFTTKRIVLIVYVEAEEEEIYEKNCEICQECSSMFYLRSEKNKCETCRILPYRRRMKDKLEAIKRGMKGKII